MTELTFEEFCKLPLTFCYADNGYNYDVRQFRNFEYDIGKEVCSEFNLKTHKFGKQTIVWFLPNDKRNFQTIDQAYVYYMEKACGVNNVPKA